MPLSTLGLLHYIAPTLQFSIGVFIYHGPFDAVRLVGFGIVWLALVVYSVEGYRHRLSDKTGNPAVRASGSGLARPRRNASDSRPSGQRQQHAAGHGE